MALRPPAARGCGTQSQGRGGASGQGAHWAVLCFLSRLISSVLWAGVTLLSGAPQGFEDGMYMERLQRAGTSSSLSSTSAEMLGAGGGRAPSVLSDSGGYDGEAFLCSLRAVLPRILVSVGCAPVSEPAGPILCSSLSTGLPALGPLRALLQPAVPLCPAGPMPAPQQLQRHLLPACLRLCVSGLGDMAPADPWGLVPFPVSGWPGAAHLCLSFLPAAPLEGCSDTPLQVGWGRQLGDACAQFGGPSGSGESPLSCHTHSLRGLPLWLSSQVALFTQVSSAPHP